jgi:hypothetical protein
MLVALTVGCASNPSVKYQKPNTLEQMEVNDSVRAKVRAFADTPEVHAKQLDGYVVLRFDEGKPGIFQRSSNGNVDDEGYAIAKKVASIMTPKEKSYNITIGLRFELKDEHEKAYVKK